jgi:hypothetical protein
MKVAIVKASELVTQGRWDAGFHIALDEVRDRVAVLKTMLTHREAVSRLAKFSLTDKKPLLVLARGSNRHLNSATITKIVDEYPHLSLAIMERNLQPAIDRMRAKIEEDEAHLDALLALQNSDLES